MGEVKFWRGIFYILVVAALLFFLIQVWSVLIPFIFGLVGAYLIQPLVDRFVALGLRRDRTVLVLYAFLLLAIVTLGFLLIPPLIHETRDALQSLPIYATKFNKLNDSISSELTRVLARFSGKQAHSISLPFRVDVLAERFVSSIPENISIFAHAGLWIFIVPFVCYFALAQSKNWVDMVFDWTPSAYVENLLGLMAEINATLGAYIRGQLLDAMCVGLMTMGGLWILGFNQAVLLGVLCGFLNPIPFLAPIVGGSLALLIAYFQGMSFAALFGIFWLFVLIRLCDDFFFTPFVVGQSVKLHPVVMLFAILAGVEVGGFMGLVFAVPLAAILKVVLAVAFHNRQQNLILQQNHIVS